MALCHFIDLTGLKINHLAVIQLHLTYNNGIPLQWECKCDCGRTCIIPGTRLRNWKAKSCGKCIRRKAHNFIDLTGQKFNMLRVVSIFPHRGKRGKVMWNCKCDCGKDKVVEGNRLKNGRTKSCGCNRLKAIADAKFVDITGRKFNMLSVMSLHSRNGKNKIKWNCLCDCGNPEYHVVAGSNLKNGAVKSCGCLGKDNFSCRTTHGLSQTRLFTIWINMKERCYNKNCPSYKNYGAKGITICDEWLNDFRVFYDWAMNNGYEDNLTIERKKYKLNYEPSNCTWIPQHEQARNRDVSLGVEKATEIKIALKEGVSVKALAEKYKVHYTTIGYIKRGKAYPYITV